MTFAFNFLGMLSFSSRVALAMSVAAAGCVTTDPIEFSPEENFPPSIISQSTAEYPLRDIGDLDLDDPVAEPELPLQVVVRDPNIDQTLQYRIFIDSPTPPGNDPPVEQDELPPTGEVDRFWTFTIPYDLLTPAGECHKVELLVSGRFASPVEPRRPLQEGDVDGVTWWIRVTDADFPVITVECR